MWPHGMHFVPQPQHYLPQQRPVYFIDASSLAPPPGLSTTVGGQGHGSSSGHGYQSDVNQLEKEAQAWREKHQANTIPEPPPPPPSTEDFKPPPPPLDHIPSTDTQVPILDKTRRSEPPDIDSQEEHPYYTELPKSPELPPDVPRTQINQIPQARFLIPSSNQLGQQQMYLRHAQPMLAQPQYITHQIPTRQPQMYQYQPQYIQNSMAGYRYVSPQPVMYSQPAYTQPNYAQPQLFITRPTIPQYITTAAPTVPRFITIPNNLRTMHPQHNQIPIHTMPTQNFAYPVQQQVLTVPQPRFITSNPIPRSESPAIIPTTVHETIVRSEMSPDKPKNTKSPESTTMNTKTEQVEPNKNQDLNPTKTDIKRSTKIQWKKTSTSVPDKRPMLPNWIADDLHKIQEKRQKVSSSSSFDELDELNRRASFGSNELSSAGDEEDTLIIKFLMGKILLSITKQSIECIVIDTLRNAKSIPKVPSISSYSRSSGNVSHNSLVPNYDSD